MGRVSTVTGSAYQGVTQYAVNAKYRAWDSLKSVDYANGFSAARTFNSRLLLTHARIGTATTAKIEGDYNYHPDGRIRFADDLVDNKYDRAYSWDHVGRLAEAYSGGEARHFANPAHPNNADGPYRQTYSYNFWGDTTSRVNRFWSQNSTHTESYVATTGRNANTIWQYNASGNLTQDFSLEYRYDATGNSVYTGHIDLNQTGARYVFETPDGDGRTARRVESTNVGGQSAFTDTYYLRSSALGGKILTIIRDTGGKMRGLVYAGGSVIAEQISSQGVTWLHENPVTGSRGYSNQAGLYIKNGEPDAAGTDVGYEDPFLYPDPPSPDPDAGGLLPDILGGSGQNGEICKLDGFQFPCFFARNFNYTGAAQPLFTDPRKRDAFTDIHILGIIGHWEEEYRQLPSTWELVPVEEEGGGIWVEWQEVLRFQTINTWRSSPLGFVHALRTGGIFRPSGGSTVLDREVKGSNNSQNQYKYNLKPCIPEWIKDDIQIKIKNELTISGADINYAGRTIFAEAADSYRGGKYKERLAIGSVLYNRIANPVFKRGSLKTFTDVANDKNQFEAITRKDLIGNTKLPYNHKFLSSDRENAGGLSEAACEELNASIQAAWNVANGGPPYGFTSFRGGTKIRPGQILIGGSRFW
jgi:hypothetical protein